jgi:hypothetical protein
MSTVTENVSSGSDTCFDEDTFLSLAQAYREDRTIVNAASKYDSLDDAIAALSSVWELLQSARENGSGYTPGTSLGFGSDSAAVIAEKIMGIGTTVGATRKALADVGKVS